MQNAPVTFLDGLGVVHISIIAHALFIWRLQHPLDPILGNFTFTEMSLAWYENSNLGMSHSAVGCLQKVYHVSNMDWTPLRAVRGFHQHLA